MHSILSCMCHLCLAFFTKKSPYRKLGQVFRSIHVPICVPIEHKKNKKYIESRGGKFVVKKWEAINEGKNCFRLFFGYLGLVHQIMFSRWSQTLQIALWPIFKKIVAFSNDLKKFQYQLHFILLQLLISCYDVI